MRLAIDLELPGLGRVLAESLLEGVPVVPTSARLTDTSLRIEGTAMGFKTVALKAVVHAFEGGATLDEFDVEGALGFKKTILDALRGRLTRLDVSSRPFHVRGAADGESLTVRWG